MSVRIERTVVGPFYTNCYLLYDDSSGEAILIDPGLDSEVILDRIKEGLKLNLIINTHGHFDHVACNGFFKRKTGARIAIHEDDVEILKSIPEQSLWFGVMAPPSPQPDLTLKEGDSVEIGEIKLKVIHTPGHTPGGICLLGDGFLFSGDTLFRGSMGRTDLPGGSLDELIRSIKTKLFTLPDETLVYPGHGEMTSIGEEREGGLIGWVF